MEQQRLIRDQMIGAAERETIVEYQALARAAGLDYSSLGDREKLWHLLEKINLEEHAARRPLLSAVAVPSAAGRDETIMPGPGFFELARTLGLFSGRSKEECLDFWGQEINRVYDQWGRRQ